VSCALMTCQKWGVLGPGVGVSQLAEMATPGTGAQYERLALAYEQLAHELERLGPKDPLRLRLDE
jgi:hypothetical protein